jgi:hypothetical protein
MNWEAITKFITTIGLPAAFASVLLWFLMTALIKRLDLALERQIEMGKKIEECCHQQPRQ